MNQTSSVLLLDPSDSAIVAALDSAADRRPDARSDWRPLLNRVAAEAEGLSRIEDLSRPRTPARFVNCAWWSDYQGRKHVRVAGGVPSLGRRALFHSKLDDDPRPPLWHVCPERVFRVKQGDAEPAWLVSCACGVTGSPESVAWMGDRCGPCHDRREEGVATDAGPVTLLLKENAIDTLAFHPSGERLLVGVARRDVEIIDLVGTDRTVLHEGGSMNNDYQMRPAVFSPDGRCLAMLDPVESFNVRLFDLTEGESRLLDWAGEQGYLTALAFSPDGKYLAGRASDGEVTIWDERLLLFFDESGGLAFSPGSDRLAVGEPSGVSILDVTTWEDIGQFGIDLQGGHTVQLMEYVQGGRSLLLITGGQEPGMDDEDGRLILWDLEGRRAAAEVAWPPSVAVAVSADGRHLARVAQSGLYSDAAVHVWDVERWAWVGVLEWDPEDTLLKLAFSPDGEWLATGSLGGVVKLWPWRALLAVD